MTSIHTRFPTFRVQALRGVPCDFVGNQQQIVCPSKYVITGWLLSEEQ